MTEAYEVIITQDGEKAEEDAINGATSTVEEITDEFGLDIDIFDTHPYGGDGKQDYGIGVNFAILSDISEDELERFLEELEAHNLVETYEGVYYESLE